jgi:2-oxoglutarate ferredoxin oxidoreductase subunit beta
MSDLKEAMYSPRDFKSDEEVRWCPGCGIGAVMKNVAMGLSELGWNHQNTVVISGIGCSAGWRAI